MSMWVHSKGAYTECFDVKDIETMHFANARHYVHQHQVEAKTRNPPTDRILAPFS
jgi:hypothetical protein